MRILTVLAVTVAVLLAAPRAMAQSAPVTVRVTGTPEITPAPEPTASPRVITVIDDAAAEPLDASPASSTLPEGPVAVAILLGAGLVLGFTTPLHRRRP